MPINIIRNVGTASRDIKNYIPKILNNVFPQLEQFGISMYNKPFTQDKVTVSYNGELYNGKSIRLYFNCIHSDIESSNDVFVDCEYSSNYFPIGSINVNNGSESAELIYSSLYAEGYRSPKDY
jgi:hypothetical protein